MFKTIAFNDAGRNRIDPHPILCPLNRQRLGEVDHTRPRRTGVRHARKTTPHFSHNIDNCATCVLHTAHIGLAAHHKGAGQICFNHCMPTFLRNFGGG